MCCMKGDDIYNMNDEEREYRGFLSGLRDKLSKQVKNKTKIMFKKIISSTIAIKLLLIALIIFIFYSIISAFLYVIDLEGFSNASSRAVKTTLEEKVDIVQDQNNGTYFKISKDCLDDFLVELNRAMFEGYYDDNAPSERDDEFEYDPDDAEIKEQDLEDWFKTKDYKKYIIKMMRAQIASSYPKIGDYKGEGENNVDANGDYVVQGIVQIKRTKMNQDRNLSWRN